MAFTFGLFYSASAGSVFSAWHSYVNALVATLLATCGAFVNHFVVTAPLGRYLKGAVRSS